MSIGYSIGFPETPPGRGPATNTTDVVWQYRENANSTWKPFTSLPGITVSDTGVTASNLQNDSYDGYQFRMVVTATQVLNNPTETIVEQKMTNPATLTVNEQIVIDDPQEPTTTPSPRIISVSSTGTVTDDLPNGGLGPAFVLRTANAIGRTVNFSVTNNTGQFSGGQLVSSGSIRVTADTMTVFPRSSQSLGRGRTRGIRKRMPTSDVFSVVGSGSGWATPTASANFTVLNGEQEITSSISPGTSIDEGDSWTVNVNAANVPEGTWSWITRNFTQGTDVSSTGASFTMGYSGTLTGGSISGSFNVNTLSDPNSFSNKTGIIEVRNAGSTLYRQFGVNIRNTDTVTPNISLSNISRNIITDYRPTSTYSGSATLNRNGSSSFGFGQWGSGIPDESKIRLYNIRNANGSPIQSLAPISTPINITGTTNKTINFSIGNFPINSGDPELFVRWNILTDVSYDNVYIGTFTTTITYRIRFNNTGF